MWSVLPSLSGSYAHSTDDAYFKRTSTVKIERLTAAFSPRDLKDLEEGGVGQRREGGGRKSMEGWRGKDADTEDGEARGRKRRDNVRRSRERDGLEVITEALKSQITQIS